VEASRIGATVAGGLEWWGRSLASCLPTAWRSGLRDAFASPRREFIVLLDGDQVKLVGVGDDGATLLDTFDMTQRVERSRAKVIRAVRRWRISGGETVVALPSSQVMRRIINLPINVESELRSALEFMVESQTPLKLDQSRWTWRVVRRDRVRQQLQVELFVAPRWALDTARETAAALRLRPARYDVVDPAGAGVVGVDLLRRGGKFLRVMTSPNMMRLGLVLALLITLVVLPLIGQRHAAADGRSADEQARPAVEAAAAAEQEIREIERQRTFFKNARSAAISPLQVVDELARVLGDDTWIFEFRLNNGEASISGSSTAASSLLAALDASPLFSDARFSAALMQGDEPGDRKSVV